MRTLAAALVCLFMTGAIEAKTVRIEITSREPFAGGQSFGAGGAYERLTGVAYGAVDPADPRNSTIVNLDKAPRNADGRVEYDTDVFILRPKEPAKGNGALLYEVNNRGMKLLAGTIMGATADPRNPLAGFSELRSALDLGDGLLLELGYTIVWSGWDPNALNMPGSLRMRAPVALDNGKPIERTIRDEFLPIASPLASPLLHLSYESASLEDKGATLTMRWREAEAGTVIPRERWRFADARTVELLPAGTKPQNGALYELHYRAKAPHVAGLGFAATRDLISYLREATDTPTPRIQRTLAIGVSQSARFLRSFVAEGFNRTENGKRVFDGMLMHIGGAGKVFLNAEFSQPSRTNTQYSDHFYPDFSFPYSATRLEDPVDGREAGILRGDDGDPKFIEVNTSTEYWQKGASLISTDPAGMHDVRLPANQRGYFLAGLPHAALAFMQGDVEQPMNMLSPMFVLRSLLMKLDAWVARGEAPPDSVLPQIEQHTLVRRADLHFPALSAVTLPSPNPAQRIADWVQPRAASGWQPTVLVPQADPDGCDLGGLRIPEVAVPLGTALGWNVYRGEQRAGQLAGLVGSFIPFAKTRAERESNHDPRRSLEERYAGKSDYVAKFRRAVDDLVARGFVRPEDAERYGSLATQAHAFD